MANYALVIAVETYTHKVDPVPFAEADAAAVAAALVDLGFSVETLLSAAATHKGIETTVHRLAQKLKKDDTVYLFYAGHGFSKGDENYLTCRDTMPKDLQLTSVALQSVFAELRKSKARRLAFFLDACGTGMEADPHVRDLLSSLDEDKLREFFSDAEFYACFTACKADQYSHSSKMLRHGVWSYHLLEALTGRAKHAQTKGLVTSSTLQNYLAAEVPKTLKRVFKDPVTQTPWATGMMTKDFIIADVQPILDALQQQNVAAAKAITQAYLNGTRTQDVRQLSGFQKGHHVPDRVSSATKGFVANISDGDLKDHLDKVYRGLRETIKYKKSGIVVEPDGFTTADFQYSVSIDLDPSDISSVIWTHRIEKMEDKDLVFSEAFSTVFAPFIDAAEFEFFTKLDVDAFIEHIEELDSEEIKVREERDASDCQVYVSGLDGFLVISEHTATITGIRNPTPKQLLEAMTAVQRALVRLKVPALPLAQGENVPAPNAQAPKLTPPVKTKALPPMVHAPKPPAMTKPGPAVSKKKAW